MKNKSAVNATDFSHLRKPPDACAINYYLAAKPRTFPWGKGDRREAVVDEGQQKHFA